VAKRRNKSIIDEFLDQYLMKGVKRPYVHQMTKEKMKELSNREAGAMYDHYYDDLFFDTEFDPNIQEQRDYGQHEILHYLDDIYVPDVDPRLGTKAFEPWAHILESTHATDEFDDQLNWDNINKMISSMPFKGIQDFADTVSSDPHRSQEILTYMAEPGTKGFAMGTGAVTNTVHDILGDDESEFDVTNLVSFISDRENVFDMFDKVTEGKMTEEGKGYFRDREDIKVQKKWGSSVIN
tara:strand:+ start:1168 stop:1881 length:714 start_codon:yes stop_codon:yes gene_type:complete